MNFCSECGQELTAGTEKFCPNCGQDLKKGGVRGGEAHSETVNVNQQYTPKYISQHPWALAVREDEG